MASSREPNSLCLKRKLVEDYLSEECKSRRIKAKNGPSFDSSAKLGNCSCIRPNLAVDCDNFLKSGVPRRIMYYRQGSWHNFPQKVMMSLIEEFSGNKSSVVSVMDDEPLLIDFLSMTMVNLKSRKQRSVAWVDDTGKCFYPSLFFNEEIDDMAKGESANVQGTAQGILSPPEVVEQVLLDSSSFVPHKLSNADILRKKITAVESGSRDFRFVQDLFLSGMGPFATPNNILSVYCYSPNDITEQCKAFERQVRSTKEQRGDSNVRYGWLGSRKNDIVRILINGLGPTGEHVGKSDLSAGVYLSPVDRTFTSVGLCDVDEKGVQYMLLCRVILGNLEAVVPGSHEFFPTSEIYDSGVDDCLYPKCYVMWPSHLSTHMQFLYLVSFKLAPEARNYLLGLKGVWFRSPSKEVAVDISALQPVMCEASEGPSTPWISFKVLFRLIQDKISFIARELLFHHDEELKEGKITREEMVKKMMIIVGEKILMEALKKLHYCPSLWYKSSVKAISSDPVKTEAEQVSLDKTGRSCNHDDSCAQNATAEHSAGPLSTKVRGALSTNMVPKGSDYPAPTGVPEISSSAGAKCLGSQGMEGEGRDSPMLIMSLGNTAPQPARYQDPTVTRIPPILSDDPLRISPGISASPGVEVCNSAPTTTAPPGCASLAPTNASKTHETLVPGSTPSPKGRESVVPILVLGSSESAGVKRLNSAPRMTPKGQEFLSLGIASQSTVLHPVKGPDASSSAARPPVYPPGRGKSPSLSTGVLSLSITPQGRDPPASSVEPKQQGSPAADSAPENRLPPQAMDAGTKVHHAPTPITRERKDQAVAQNKLPGPGLDGCSHVETLIALSTPREKGER